MSRPSRPLLSTLALCLLAACGDDGASPGADASVPTIDASDPIDGNAPPAEPIYLLHSAVQGSEGRTNYFTAIDALGRAETIDYGASLEVPGRARLYAEPGIGFFAIGDGEDVSVTRYTLSEDGAFEAGERLSFQAYGVTAMGAQAVLFVSATKAYYKDSDQAQIIVWNPTEMTVDGTIELPAELVREGRVLGLSQWASRDGEAFFAAGWSTPEYDRVDPGSALVRIDTATDAITVTSDSRCRGLGRTGRDGETLYFFSDVINGFGHAVYPGEGGQVDCALRIAPGESTFDATYVGSIAPALAEREIGTVIAVSGEHVWAQVVDTTMVPTTPGTTYSEWYATGWRWVRLDLEALGDASRVVRIPGDPGAYTSLTFSTGDHFFISRAAPDYSTTTLVDLASGTPTPGVTFPGFSLDVARVR